MKRDTENGNAGKPAKRKKKLFLPLYAAVLLLFTVYVLLDTFVIERTYVQASSASAAVSQETAAAEEEETSSRRSGRKSRKSAAAETETETESAAAAEGGTSLLSAGDGAVVTETSYEDDNISVTLTTFRVNDTTVYAAEAVLSDPSLLKTALAKGSYGRNVTQKTSEMAEANGAVLAVNGDYYGAQETGYVIRGGILYRSPAKAGKEDLVIWEDGSLSVITEGEITAEQLLADGAAEVLSFGPALVTDGEIAVDADDEVGKAMASNPRTAVGITADGHYLFVVSDGRTSESEGLSLLQLAQVMKDLGAVTAYNLDGGGSSAMVFNGQLVNKPTTGGSSIKERSVSDIVYIGY